KRLIEVFIVLDVIEHLRPQDADDQLEAEDGGEGEDEEGEVEPAVQTVVAAAKGDERRQEDDRDEADGDLEGEDDVGSAQHGRLPGRGEGQYILVARGVAPSMRIARPRTSHQ